MTKIGKWRKGKCIGNGGNASVFIVTDNDNIRYALKRLDNQKNGKLERFIREVTFVDEYPQLLKDELILPLFDKDLECESPYYVMPLATPLKEYKFNTLADKCIAITQILEVISKFHELEIAHRDIKPENILLYNGRFYLADFGLLFIEKAERITKENNTERIGAKRTIAPEMERSASYEADPYKADVYSIAKTIWMILTEDWDCFEGQYSQDSIVSLEQYDQIGTFDDGLIPSPPYYMPLDSLLSECTDHDPNRRPSLDNMIERFNHWIEINQDFHLRNNIEWIEITDKLFPIKTPRKAVWTDRKDIVTILNFLCKYKGLAYVFLPQGGQHYKGVKECLEDKYIEFDMGMPYLFPAKSLTFYSVGANSEWNFFRLDSFDDVKPVFIETLPDDVTNADEELTELSPGQYAPYEVWETEEEYEGFVPTREMRRVARYYRGSYVLFNTRSSYNLESSTHNRHSYLSKDEFEFYIRGCSRGDFSLKYSECIIDEVKEKYAMTIINRET